jgi:hypothetical protein
LESALSGIQRLKSALKTKRDGARTLERKEMGLKSIISDDWGLKNAIDKVGKCTIWYTKAKKCTKKEKR